MRGFRALAVMVMLAGCGVGNEVPENERSAEEIGSTEHGLLAPEQFCNSYKEEKFCPKYTCAWFAQPAPGRCGAPAEM